MDDNNRRTPAEVAAEASVEHTAKGLKNRFKGSLKDAWGKLTDNPKSKLEGKVDQVKGQAQTGLGKFEAKEAEIESRGTWSDEDDTLRQR